MDAARTATEEEVAYGIDEIVRRDPKGRLSIYKAITEGRLIARKDGRRTLVLRSDYVNYLRSLPPIQPKAADKGRS